MNLVLDGHWFRIHIHRIETESMWTLEVVDAQQRSTAWLDAFDTAQEARDAALSALEAEGPEAFIREADKVNNYAPVVIFAKTLHT